MAEITVSFGGKEISITYPDEMIGKAEEAFVAVKSHGWQGFYTERLDALDEDDPSEEQLANWKYEFTVGCIVGYVTRTMRQHTMQNALEGVKEEAKASANAALGQISLEIQ